MSFLGSDDRHRRERPVARLAGAQEEDRRVAASDHLGVGSLACPRCDAPVSIGTVPRSPAEPVLCPFCAHGGALRDFLSLAMPTRPARVVVRVHRAA